MPDRVFANPRLAALYDPAEEGRGDLIHYERIVSEFGAQSVLDLGCGTGTLACRLAQSGIKVVGVDPAEASLQIAQSKPHAERVQWILGDATSLPDIAVDMAVMTGNVAQVFLTDEDWLGTLAGAREALVPGGHLVFEIRDPAFCGWEEWNREQSFTRLQVDGEGEVETWVDLLDVKLPYVSFRWTYRFANDGAELHSDSTLRFRSRDEIERSLEQSGYRVLDGRDAPDRPGKEFVFIAQP